MLIPNPPPQDTDNKDRTRTLVGEYTQGHTGGGRPECTGPPSCTQGGGLISFPQAFYILHCIALTHAKRLRKEMNYILVHNNTLLIKYC